MVFCGKGHDNKILNVQILLSSNFVVIAQAPISSRLFFSCVFCPSSSLCLEGACKTQKGKDKVSRTQERQVERGHVQKQSWEPTRLLQRSLGARKSRNSPENVSLGLRPRDPKKSPQSPGALQKHSPDTFRRLSGDFSDCHRDFLETFWARETFSGLFRDFPARRARETSVRGGASSQQSSKSDTNDSTLFNSSRAKQKQSKVVANSLFRHSSEECKVLIFLRI